MSIKLTMDDLRVGQVYPTTKGGDVTVKRIGRDSHDIIVQFNDKRKYRKVVHLRSLIKGHIRNPYTPNTFGVGYLGVGPYMTRKDSEEGVAYATWYAIMKKCYGPNPTHTVDECWHKYQNFARWHNKQIKPTESKYFININLIHHKNKHYSARTAFLLPLETMKRFSPPAITGSVYPAGVSKQRVTSSRVKASIGKVHLGTYNTADEAHMAYQREIEKRLYKTADKFKDELEPRAYALLKEWQYTIYD